MLNPNFNKYYKIAYKFKDNSTDLDVKILEQELKLIKNDNIIDIWCWYWRVSNCLIDGWYTVSWIDYSEDFINEAKENSNWNEDYVLWDFTNLKNYFKINSFDKVYSMYSSLWHTIREDDENVFRWISSILKKWWLFLFEYENYVFHIQNKNLFKHDYYDIDWEYRRILDIKVNWIKSSINIWNEFWDIKNEKLLDKWSFDLILYSYYEIIQLWKKYWLELVKLRWRLSENEVYWNEPQAIFVFKKISN